MAVYELLCGVSDNLPGWSSINMTTDEGGVMNLFDTAAGADQHG
jgi:hypothetical protein